MVLRAYGLVVMTSPSHKTFLGENEVKEYIDIFELSGITKGHKKEVQRSIENYLEYLNYKINKKKSIRACLKNNFMYSFTF